MSDIGTMQESEEEVKTDGVDGIELSKTIVEQSNINFKLPDNMSATGESERAEFKKTSEKFHEEERRSLEEIALFAHLTMII